MTDFEYTPIYSLFDFKNIEFDKISKDYISEVQAGNSKLLKIDAKALEAVSQKSFSMINYFFSKSHLQQLSNILKDKNSSENDKFVAKKLIENAVAASSGIFPLCQDTGTASVIGEKGNLVLTDFDEKKAISQGVYNTYTQENLRYSQLLPNSVFEEYNSKTNLPAQIDLYSGKGRSFKFLFVAKGGGSSNKTFFFTENKSVLNFEKLKKFLEENIKKIGTAACPPYHLGIVIGGTSPEMNLKTLKLLTAGALDHIPHEKNNEYLALRDKEVENLADNICLNTGLGAQYGGRYFCLDSKVLRLPRHGTSVFISIGVSCYAHRNQFAFIDKTGIFLEKKEKEPSIYLPDEEIDFKSPVHINLDQPMEKIRKKLSELEVSVPVLLTGDIVVARDIAHAEIMNKLEKENYMPDYLKNHPVYYAGPAKIPECCASGSFGPTTSARMDSYVHKFQEHGGSLVMIGKGNRTPVVKKACSKFKGFYLGAIGGAAALVGKESVKKVEVIDYEELGMEAVHKIRVENFPAFLVTDDKGNDFFDKS
jgi:fumarate hydratase class I